MNMKGKISLLSLLLVLLVLFSVSGCERSTTNNSEAETTTEATEASSNDEAVNYPVRQKLGMEKKTGVYYEIFVRSFADSNADGIGDFNGITEKLDYLKELGIDGLWLMPINASSSYHGYDVTDYYELNPEYGDESDFKRLLDEAHSRDIKVIMDFVINHTGSEHSWFEASKNPDSKYRDFYQWRNEDDDQLDLSDRSPWGSEEWHRYGDSYYFGMFWSGMPDLNYDNDAVRAEIKNAAAKWLEMGVDGFRLDAAMHIYGDNENKNVNQLQKNLEWWNEFALACEDINPSVYLVGEAWQGNAVLAQYAQPFDSKFNFGFEEVMIEKITAQNAMYSSDKSLAKYYEEILDEHNEAAEGNYIDAVFGTNHDQNRMMSTLADNDKCKLAASVYMTLGGNPFIYYGEEIGMEGEKPDENIREPFLWSDDDNFNTTWMNNIASKDTIPLSEQIEDANSMYSFYKDIISVRKSSKSLSEGDFKALDIKDESIMAYSRTKGTQTSYVFHNFSNETLTIDIDKVNGKIIYSRDKDSSSSDKVSDFDKITIAAFDTVIIESEA